MKRQQIVLVCATAVLGLLFGLVAAGVQAINQPEVESFDFNGGSYEPLLPDGSSGGFDGDVFGGNETDAPAPTSVDDRTPGLFGSAFPNVGEEHLGVSSLVAVPAATTLAGVAVGVAGALAGFRVTRRRRP